MSSVAFIGGGNMAHAMATRLAAVQTGRIVVSDPVPEQLARFAPPVATTADNAEAARQADTVVLAVKPQVLGTVVRDLAPAIDRQLVMSIAAGVPLAAIERWLGPGRAVVRVMPNTPALVGAGISGAVANPATTADQRERATAILAAAGDVVWLDSDAELDVVTALSGSGPAYFFHAFEALVAAGEALGLAPETAKRLVVATGAGAAAMARDEDPGELRRRVTSPGGTTEAALAILAERAFGDALDAAVRGAAARSRELAREFG